MYVMCNGVNTVDRPWLQGSATDQPDGHASQEAAQVVLAQMPTLSLQGE